jgi:hypothetical protein
MELQTDTNSKTDTYGTIIFSEICGYCKEGKHNQCTGLPCACERNNHTIHPLV